jgi:hypothetical protein
METDKIFSQMIDYQKIHFDNTFHLMSMLQSQGEQVINMSIEQNPWIPDDGKKICAYWTEAYKKQMNNYKSFVDTNFDKLKEMMASHKKEAEA